MWCTYEYVKFRDDKSTNNQFSKSKTIKLAEIILIGRSFELNNWILWKGVEVNVYVLKTFCQTSQFHKYS